MSTSPVKIAANWAAIRTLAPDRFDAFKRPGDGDELDAIARYVWNMAVCRSLQPSLHTVEVTFRNQVNNALAALRGPTWYDIPGFLSPRDMLMLNQAKTTLQRLHRPLDPGRVVAELNFGFWTQLYGQKHEQNIVRPTIQSVFPRYSGAAALQRSAVSAHLRDAKTLRNRISHHEPIVFDVKLPQYHTQVMELIQWMSPQMTAIAEIDDEFSRVYGATWKSHRPIVEDLFG